MNKRDFQRAVTKGIRDARDEEETAPLTWHFMMGLCLLGSSIIIGVVYESWIAFGVLFAIALFGMLNVSYIVTVVFAIVNAHIFYIFFRWSDVYNQHATGHFWASIVALFAFIIVGLAFTRSLKKGWD